MPTTWTRATAQYRQQPCHRDLNRARRVLRGQDTLEAMVEPLHEPSKLLRAHSHGLKRAKWNLRNFRSNGHKYLQKGAGLAHQPVGQRKFMSKIQLKRQGMTHFFVVGQGTRPRLTRWTSIGEEDGTLATITHMIHSSHNDAYGRFDIEAHAQETC